MRVVDLFAGSGGLSLGFQLAGFEVVAAYDNWDPTIKVYNANFDHLSIKQDLSEDSAYLSILELSPDVIIGGPPCQDFSSAGKRDEDGGRADLTVSYADIIGKVKPKYFVMENVERIQKSYRLKQAVEIFKSQGYGLSHMVLDASYCGVPQSRKRFFLVGIQGGENHQLNNYFVKNMSKKPMTVRDYFGNSLGIEYYYRHPRNYNRRAIYSIDEPSPTIRGVNRPIPKGYMGHKLDAQRVSDNVRPLTTYERSLIQTFPPEFKWLGSKTEQEQMIGNAVPVNLAKFVARCLLEYIEDKQNNRVQISKNTIEIQQLDLKI